MEVIISREDRQDEKCLGNEVNNSWQNKVCME